MGRVRKAAAVFDKIRKNEGIWPLSWEDLIVLIEYQQLCNQACLHEENKDANICDA